MESNGRGTELKGKEEGENTKVCNMKKMKDYNSVKITRQFTVI